MATNDKKDKTTEQQETAPTTIDDAQANAKRAEGDRTSLPDDAKHVSVAEGTEHGYIGTVPDQTPDEEYTVTGVTDGTAKTTDTPKSADRRS